MQRPAHDEGFTLIEVLLALVLLSVSVVALVGGLTSVVFTSGVHRANTVVGTLVQQEAAAVQAGALACPTVTSSPAPSPTPAIAIPTVTAPAGYAVGASPAAPACPVPGTATTVTVSAASNDGRATEAATVVVQAP